MLVLLCYSLIEHLLVAQLSREWEVGQFRRTEQDVRERGGDLLLCHVGGERAVLCERSGCKDVL